MKTTLLLAALLGLSATGAWANCPGHVSAKADAKMTVASIDTSKAAPPATQDASKQKPAPAAEQTQQIEQD